MLGLKPQRQTWHKTSGGWQSQCQRCGRWGRMVEVSWLMVLTRHQCPRGVGCQKKGKKRAATPRPKPVTSRQVAGYVTEGRKVAQGLDRETRRRMGLP